MTPFDSVHTGGGREPSSSTRPVEGKNVKPSCATRVPSHGVTATLDAPRLIIVYSMVTTPASFIRNDFVTAIPRARLGAPSKTAASPTTAARYGSQSISGGGGQPQALCGLVQNVDPWCSPCTSG